MASDNPRHHKWPAYLLNFLALYIATLFVIALAYPNSTTTPAIFFWLIGIINLGIVISALGSFVGYYRDINYIRENLDWNPSYLWIVGHLLFAPLVAILYLWRRNGHVGNEYTGTLLKKLPWMG